MRVRAWFFAVAALVGACSAFGAASDDNTPAPTGDAGPAEAGAEGATPSTSKCPENSLYCLDFEGPARGTYASVELTTQTPIAAGAVLAAPVARADGGNAVRFVLPASANAFVEFAAKTFTLPVTDDVQLDADILIDDPHMSLVGNSLTLLVTAANMLNESRVEAKIDGNSDGTIRIDMYSREEGISPGDPTTDDKTKLGVPFGSWFHLTIQSRLAGTTSDAGASVVMTDRSARLVREMKRNPNATKTMFVFGIGKSIATPFDITATFDNVTVTKLP